MTYKVAAFYQFAALPDFRELREPLRAICAGLELKGSVLLAHEGINGTLAGERGAIDALVGELRDGASVRRPARQSRAEILASLGDAVSAAENPAEKGDRHPRRCRGRSDAAGRHLCRPRRLERADREPRHAGDRHPQCIRGRDGHVRGRASIPASRASAQFKDFAARHLDPAKHRRIAMFCTGGIRCEKASAYLLSRGFAEVYHLKGGILRYLEDVPEAREPLARRMFRVRRTRRARPRIARTRDGAGFR